MSASTTLEKFGFKFGQSGAHSARSLMLAELRVLFASNSIDTTREHYQADICDHNLLDKPTSRSRELTYRHLLNLYGLSSAIPLFKVFRQLWAVDEESQPLLCLQLALARDPLLRLSLPLIAQAEIGSLINRQDVENLLKTPDPERFSPASLKSFAQNINGSWTQAGFLHGRAKKHRIEPVVTPVNVTFALFQAYLKGDTGERLLNSCYCKLFGISGHRLNELAIAAGHLGLIDFKQSGGVTEIHFPEYLTADQKAWLYE